MVPFPFLIAQIKPQLLHPVPQLMILGQQDILIPAGHQEAGLLLLLRALLRQEEQIVLLRDFQLFAIDGPVFIFSRLTQRAVYQLLDITGRRKCRTSGIPFRIGERTFQRAVSAHRQPGYEPMLPVIRHPEHLADEPGQFLGNIVEIPQAVFHIGIHTSLYFWYYHSNFILIGISLQAGQTEPVGAVI